MNIELSPGEWAGVMDVLKARASQLREAPLVDDDPHEQADDYDRIAGVIREHLARPALPELVPPPLADVEDGEWHEATCQHVWTEEEVQAMRQRDADHAAAYRDRHPDWDPPVRAYPAPGEACGAELIYWTGVPYMHYASWAKGQWREGDEVALRLDSGKIGDGEIGEDELNCGHGHVWAIPDDVDWT